MTNNKTNNKTNNRTINMTCQNALPQEAAGHRHFCSIVPSYVLRDIADGNVPEKVRLIAAKSLDDVAAIHEARTSAQGKDLGPSAAVGTTFAVGPTPKPVYRKIYDAQQQDLDRLPGTLLFQEDGFGALSVRPPSDESARNVFEHFQKIFDFYLAVFNRNSYDGKGANLDISVHFDGDPGIGYDNAFWYPVPPPGYSQWAFGDGDFVLMDNFTKSIADIFGSMIKQYFAPGGPQKAEDADWLVGEGIWMKPGGRALRDMENPGTAFDIPRVTKDRQTAHMDNYEELQSWDDNGGVHIYSGIPNRAFVLAAKALGGFSWEVAGQIWYASLTDPRLRNLFIRNGDRPSEQTRNTFNFFANLTIEHAQAYLAHSPNAVTAVKNAWKAVGLPR
ncbi:hypothetical protein BGZ81_001561 [Podila clonocystis]|nr:hypothetical protein BGZ81_001561 [Podila clonocystis]